MILESYSSGGNKDIGLISIIVPVYNREKVIKRCLDSILAQTYNHIEVILIDDGSTDLSSVICDQYAAIDSRIKVIHTKNGGPSAARNIGLSTATGEYIGFVDSDDYISETMYEKLAAGLTGDIDMSICFFQRYNPEEDAVINISVDVAPGVYNTIELEKLLFTNPEPYKDVFIDAVWNKLFKRQLLEGLYFRGRYYEDSGLMDQIYCKEYMVRVIQDSPYYYVASTISLSTLNFNKDRLFMLIVFANRWKLFDDKYIQLNARKQFCKACLGFYSQAKEIGIRYKRKIRELFFESMIVLLKNKKIDIYFLMKSLLFMINPDFYAFIIRMGYGFKSNKLTIRRKKKQAV